MKLKLDQVIFINLLFRIFLLVYLLTDEKLESPGKSKSLKHWLDPISKRVILIFVNGLNLHFLNQNSTPFLKEVLENYGTFGVALTGYMQTNHEGIKAVLTGRESPLFPFSWMNAECQDNVLNQVTFSCGMGKLPPELSWRCFFPDDDPLESFQKFPGLFEMKRRKSSLYVLSVDLDPVYLSDYQFRLRKIDEGIRFLAKMVDNFYGDNRTTYILTSARGSPVGDYLSTDAPVITWGKGIEYYEEVTIIRQTDLTAMLCALLGVSFPSGFVGVIPMSMMDLQDHYEMELTLYNIRHFERVLEIVDVKDHTLDSTQLEIDQLGTRLEHIMYKIRRGKYLKWTVTCCWLVLLLLVWGLNIAAFASCGFACFFFHLKSLFLLLLVVGTTLTYGSFALELIVALELALFCTWQNSKQIWEAFSKHVLTILQAIFAMFAVVTLVGFIGNEIMQPIMLVPVIIWPVLDGSFLRINRYVLFTRLLSGIAVGALPLNRVFGESPDKIITTSVSFIFLINFYFIISMFKRGFDTYIRINYLVILATTAHVYFIQYELPVVKDVLSCLFLAFSFLSVYAASGTPLERFFKIFLSLFIPVLMLAIRLECVFYLSIFLHMFSWIFSEYPSPPQQNPVQYQLHPSVFSIEPKKPFKAIRFSDEDVRHIVFFLVYSYLSYFAIGHFPDLHSYDLYVVPKFILQYPEPVSYCLAGFKFFLPFFILTTSFLTLCLVKEKSFKPLLLVLVWLSDLIGAFLVLYSQLANRMFRRTTFPARFPYFIIQQFATISVILSYFAAKYLLLTSDRFFMRVCQKKSVEGVAKN